MWRERDKERHKKRRICQSGFDRERKRGKSRKNLSVHDTRWKGKGPLFFRSFFFSVQTQLHEKIHMTSHMCLILYQSPPQYLFDSSRSLVSSFSRLLPRNYLSRNPKSHLYLYETPQSSYSRSCVDLCGQSIGHAMAAGTIIVRSGQSAWWRDMRTVHLPRPRRLSEIEGKGR